MIIVCVLLERIEKMKRKKKKEERRKETENNNIINTINNKCKL
jgi:hypothetical protein